MTDNFLEKMKLYTSNRVALLEENKNHKSTNLNFCDIFQNESLAIIAEIKFYSPSRGKIYHGDLDHLAIAKAYLDAGASAISVLTEPYFFKGNISYVSEIRATYPKAHILLKDFVLSKKQIDQACQHGANAILLIVSFLEKTLLEKLYEYALSLNITPIIEAHHLDELIFANQLNPVIIGINNRNLRTLKTDIKQSQQLIQHVLPGCFALCESGITTAAQLAQAKNIGFHGCLIGSALMSSDQPGDALKELLP